MDQEELEQISRETRLSSHRGLRWFLIGAGSLFVALGVVGIILPVLPTTPFLLLAAACYARGSEKFYVWLLTNRFFGQYIRDWRDDKGIPYWTKIWITFVLLATLAATAFFFVPVLYVQIVLLGVGVGVSWYIWSLPTKESLPSEG